MNTYINNIYSNSMQFKGNPIKQGKLTKKYTNFLKKFPNSDIPTILLDNRNKKEKVLKKKYINKGLDIIDNKITFVLTDLVKDINNLYTDETYEKELELDLNLLGSKGLKKIFDNLRSGERFILETKPSLGNPKKFFIVNNDNKNKLYNLLTEGNNDNIYSTSDDEFKLAIDTSRNFNLRRVKLGKNTQGSFFKWTISNNINYDDKLQTLKRYGIYNIVDADNYNENCLIKALKLFDNISIDDIQNVKAYVKSSFVPMCKLKEISKVINKYIVIKKIFTNKDGIFIKTKNYYYGNKTLDRITIGLIEEHYFIVEPTKFTSYSIKNYKNVYNKNPDKWNLYKAKNHITKTDFINSFDVIKFLLENKNIFLDLIINSSELFSTPYYSNVKDIVAIEFDEENDSKNIELNKNYNKGIEILKVFFDFETDVYTKTNIHDPYLCWYYCLNGDKKVFYGKDCGKQLLKHLYNKYHLRENFKIKMIAHNFGYDFRVGIFKWITQPNLIEKGSSIMSGTAKYYNYDMKSKPLELIFADSYCLISSPLRNFKKLFPQIQQEKDLMPYPLYHTENIKKRYIPLKECLKHIKKQDVKRYLDNCKKWNCIINDCIDIIEYSSQYCLIDCKVLSEGYEIFRKQIIEVCDLDIDDYISIASIADAYLIKQGCYINCKFISGVVRSFIQKCLVGGRTMLNSNKKLKINGSVADYDGVSLYPSSMYRLDGFLKGCPKLLKDKTYRFLKNVDGYYIKIKITKVGLFRDFPLLSYLDKNGIRCFSNQIVGRTIYIDKYSLEDAIKFQKIEFDIIEGYYFNDGFNPKIKETISYLFNERLKQKKLGNPIEVIYKLIMNSSYGKTALKEIDTDIKFITNDRFDNYLSNNYNFIKEITQTEDLQGYRFKMKKPINKHFNRVHIGIQVLSMSKRIMNEVMCLAEDLKIKMFYQDTDSIHLLGKDVKLLEDNFRTKYNRELNGKNLGQFHIDFSMKDCKDIYSEKFIGLGKKSYIDCLVGTDIKTGEIKKDYHIRLKGIPNGSIIAYAKDNNMTPLEIYEQLYIGKPIIFDLLRDGDNDKVRFKSNNDMSMTTLKSFPRKVQFKKK